MEVRHEPQPTRSERERQWREPKERLARAWETATALTRPEAVSAVERRYRGVGKFSRPGQILAAFRMGVSDEWRVLVEYERASVPQSSDEALAMINRRR